jgi:alpha-1,3/alpha-1,6-mannosyltransferase
LNLDYQIYFSKDPKATSLNSRVIFVPSFTDSQRTFLLKTSLCLFYTPSFEHFGIVPIEAMYSQLPVIAVNNGGPTESIVHKMTGYLCDPEPGAFARAALELLKPDQKEVLGRHGRKRVLEKFSLDSFTEKLESKIKELVEQSNEEAHKTWIIWNSVWLLFAVQLFSVAFLLQI